MSGKMVWICPKCGSLATHENDKIGVVCGECGTPLVCTGVSANEVRSLMKDGGSQFVEWTEKMREKYVPGYVGSTEINPFVPKCPTCGCPIIRPLAHHESNFHFAQTNGHANWACKTFLCLNCGYAW